MVQQVVISSSNSGVKRAGKAFMQSMQHLNIIEMKKAICPMRSVRHMM